jgi:hypothetical protein
MKQTSHITIESFYLRAVFEGEVDLTDSRMTLTEIRDAAHSANLQRVVIDVSNVQGELSTMERFEMGSSIAEVFAGIRVAIVIPDALRHPSNFGENVAVNSGAILKLFADLESARCWLREGPN